MRQEEPVTDGSVHQRLTISDLSLLKQLAQSAVDQGTKTVQWRFVTGILSRLASTEDDRAKSESFTLLQLWIRSLVEALCVAHEQSL